MPTRSQQAVLQLLRSRPAVELADIQAALGGASRATTFRYLKGVPYRSSYNHNGRFFALDDPGRYDRDGLFSVGDVHFSRDGTVKATVVRMVREAEGGCLQRELQERLRIRVRGFLLTAFREEAIDREEIDGLFLYLHADPELRQEQLRRRRELIDHDPQIGRIDDETVIRILLVLIRHPGSTPGDVTRHLKGRAPPITQVQVDVVFSRFGLGEKGGPPIY
jgi:hypothetical protein